MSEERQAWGSKLQFLLTCIGFSVGLGNLWKFPGVAYKHGGGAFLLPYLLCSLFLGLPCLYLELFIGQFIRTGATQAFRRYKPVFHGIGWTSTIMAAMVGIFYNMIVAICILYLKDAIIGDNVHWTHCQNPWNTANCRDIINISSTDKAQTLPTDEYFKYKIYNEDPNNHSIAHFGYLNWQLLIALASMWILTCICLIRGVSWIGYISYVTATVPYIIIGCLFVNSLFLEGALAGMKQFLLPQFSKLGDFGTWVAAANQLCLSLSIGYGGILALSSFNPSDHNCFKDAAIVVFADGFMSVFGGCVVYGTLGFISHKTGIPVEKISDSGSSGLAFALYPFALTKMPGGRIWAAALFLMFFLLGISSQFGLSQNVVTSITDQFPNLAKKSYLVVIAVCGSSFFIAFLTCFQNGKKLQGILADHTGNTPVFLIIFLEIIVVIHLYGIHNFMYDLRSSLGKASSTFEKYFGHTGYIFAALWLIICPTILIFLIGYSFVSSIKPADMPPMAEYIVNLFIEFMPALAIPIFFILNLYLFYKSTMGWKEAFKVQPNHPSYHRVRNSGKVFPQDESKL